MTRPIGIVLCVSVAACSSSHLTADDMIGTWGGQHARLVLAISGGSIEYDCAHGHVAQGWSVSEFGQFSGTGYHIQETGGPGLAGDSASRPARYDGTVEGNTFHFTVTLTDSAKVFGTFTLTRGVDGSVFKCLTL